jgi:hypothetical protein
MRSLSEKRRDVRSRLSIPTVITVIALSLSFSLAAGVTREILYYRIVSLRYRSVSLLFADRVTALLPTWTPWRPKGIASSLQTAALSFRLMAIDDPFALLIIPILCSMTYCKYACLRQEAGTLEASRLLYIQCIHACSSAISVAFTTIVAAGLVGAMTHSGPLLFLLASVRGASKLMASLFLSLSLTTFHFPCRRFFCAAILISLISLSILPRCGLYFLWVHNQDVLTKSLDKSPSDQIGTLLENYWQMTQMLEIGSYIMILIVSLALLGYRLRPRIDLSRGAGTCTGGSA